MREAEQIIAKLINEQVITGEEAIILLNACKVPQLFIPEKKEDRKWDCLNNTIKYAPNSSIIGYNPGYTLTVDANSTSCGG